MMPMITKEKILMLLDEACRDLDVHVALGRLPEAKVTYGQLKTAQSYIEKNYPGEITDEDRKAIEASVAGFAELRSKHNVGLDSTSSDLRSAYLSVQSPLKIKEVTTSKGKDVRNTYRIIAFKSTQNSIIKQLQEQLDNPQTRKQTVAELTQGSASIKSQSFK